MGHITYRILKNLSSNDRKVMENAFNAIYDEYKYLVFYIAFTICERERNRGRCDE